MRHRFRPTTLDRGSIMKTLSRTFTVAGFATLLCLVAARTYRKRA